MLSKRHADWKQKGIPLYEFPRHVRALYAKGKAIYIEFDQHPWYAWVPISVIAQCPVPKSGSKGRLVLKRWYVEKKRWNT